MYITDGMDQAKYSLSRSELIRSKEFGQFAGPRLHVSAAIAHGWCTLFQVRSLEEEAGCPRDRSVLGKGRGSCRPHQGSAGERPRRHRTRAQHPRNQHRGYSPMGQWSHREDDPGAFMWSADVPRDSNASGELTAHTLTILKPRGASLQDMHVCPVGQHSA